MKATQGVILIMIAALLLFLTWSTKSILQSKRTPTVGPTDPNIAGDFCPAGTKEHFVGATRYCLPDSTSTLAHTNDGLVRA